MSLAELTEVIFESARAEASTLKDHYSQEATREQSRITALAKAEEERVISAAQKRADAEVRRVWQEAELESRARVLQAKQKELLSLKDAAVAAIHNWNSEASKKFIISLMAMLPKEDGELVAGELHADIISTLAPARAKVSSETIPNEGGFVYRTKTSELNLTVNHLIDRLFQSRRSEIAKLLFG